MEWSTTSAPVASPPATPSAPKSTVSTSGVSETQTKTTSLSAATASGDPPTVRTQLDQRIRLGLRAIPDGDLVAGADQVGRHAGAHDPEADEAEALGHRQLAFETLEQLKSGMRSGGATTRGK